MCVTGHILGGPAHIKTGNEKHGGNCIDSDGDYMEKTFFHS